MSCLHFQALKFHVFLKKQLKKWLLVVFKTSKRTQNTIKNGQHATFQAF